MAARLFVDPDPGASDRGLLDAAGARHLRALRLVPGDAFRAIVGPGDEREAIVESLGPGGAVCRLKTRIDGPDRDPKRPLTLAIGLADLSRLDPVVEKATELGATRILFFRAARSQAATVAPPRLERWRRIARAACEQCGRTVPPEIVPVGDLAGVLADAGAPSVLLLFDPPHDGAGGPATGAARTRAAARRVGAAESPILAIVGPEGGLTESERAAALAHGAIRVELGGRILRFDTAALAALAAVAAWSIPAPAGIGPGPLE